MASADVAEALAELFDKRPEGLLVVSAYDHTILYANPALASIGPKLGGGVKHLPVDFIGRDAREMAQHMQIKWENTALSKTLIDGQTHTEKMHGADAWGCASLLPLGDISKSVIATAHAEGLSEAEAMQQHIVAYSQVTIALEFAESERLIQVGMEALHRARQRMQSLRETLLSDDLRQHFPNS